MPLIEATMITDGIPHSSYSWFLYERQDMKTAIAVIKWLLNRGTGDTLDQEFLSGIRKDLYTHNEEVNLRTAFEIPSTYVNSIEQVLMNIEEERRLMYVAMIRAMERFIITHRRRQTGEPITVATRFLGEFGE